MTFSTLKPYVHLEDSSVHPCPSSSIHHYAKTDEEEKLQLQKAIAASLTPSSSFIGTCQKEGLYNLGNTCWFNGLTQAIFKNGTMYCHALREKAFQEIDPSLAAEQRQVANTFKTRAKAFLDLIEASEKPSNKANNQELYRLQEAFEVDFCSTMGLPIGLQHDPSEGFHRLCEFLDLELIFNKFEIQTHLQAIHTASSSFERKEAVTTIVLASDNIDSLQAGMDRQFMNPERLSGDACYSFEDGLGPQETYKTDYITATQLPRQIIVQAPRFRQRLDPGLTIGRWQVTAPKYVREKITHPVDFNETLRIPLYDQYGTRVEKIAILKLISVIGHRSKILGGGHYVAYKREENGQFTCYNDSQTSQLSGKQAKEQIAKEGYLAVYETYQLEDFSTQDLPTLQTVLPQALDLPILPAEDEPQQQVSLSQPAQNARSLDISDFPAQVATSSTTPPLGRGQLALSACATSQKTHRICAQALSQRLNTALSKEVRAIEYTAAVPLTDRLTRYKNISDCIH